MIFRFKKKIGERIISINIIILELLAYYVLYFQFHIQKDIKV